MAHKIVYVESPFLLRWFRLDMGDVYDFQSFVRENWSLIPDRYKQCLMNIYNDLNKPKNPRNTKFLNV